MQATATAHPNIALIKYWGKRNIPLNLPSTSSLSVTLDTFQTVTTVTWGTDSDSLTVNGSAVAAPAARRALDFLSLIDPRRPPCAIVSSNNFPTAAGLASSASAFAALALAGTAAAGQSHTPTALSRLARQGSGSACRSLWGGWVLWDRGEAADGHDSHGTPLAPRDHWDIKVVVAMVSAGRKPIGSTAGMIKTQETSPLYPGWVSSAEADITQARDALARRDLAALGEAMERSTLKMHATMISAGIRYWKPTTVAVLEAVEALRREGVGAWYTMDAGPNVKVLCESADAQRVVEAVQEHVEQVAVLGVGGDAVLS
jgi:diphosphomevalonate decarboxylase